MVNITCRVLSRPSIPELAKIYRELGTDYDERVLPSIVNEVLKSVIAQFNASQRKYIFGYTKGCHLYPNRPQLRSDSHNSKRNGVSAYSRKLIAACWAI